MHSFDYNTDHLGIGTIDAPEWRIDNRRRAYATAAAAARGGGRQSRLRGRLRVRLRRCRREQLGGFRRYELRLDSMPSGDAFWSLTIYMQRESPGPDKEPNWLPTPAGDFRPIMRMYQPKPDVLAGSYALPAIRKVG